jgi:hypothetical protein
MVCQILLIGSRRQALETTVVLVVGQVDGCAPLSITHDLADDLLDLSLLLHGGVTATGHQARKFLSEWPHFK